PAHHLGERGLVAGLLVERAEISERVIGARRIDEGLERDGELGSDLVGLSPYVGPVEHELGDVRRRTGAIVDVGQVKPNEPSPDALRFARSLEGTTFQLLLEKSSELLVVAGAEGKILRHGEPLPPGALRTSASASPSTRYAARVPGGGACPSASGRTTN